MIETSYKALLFILFLGYSGYVIGADTPAENCGKLTESCGKLTEGCSGHTENSGKLTEYCGELTESCGKLTEYCGEKTTDDVSKEEDVSTGDSEAGEARYKKSCINCHGAAGKGVASYPKVSGQEISYTKSKLETYRDGIEIGPNSSLMIMMAKPLTDEEIANLAAYLKDAKP